MRQVVTNVFTCSRSVFSSHLFSRYSVKGALQGTCFVIFLGRTNSATQYTFIVTTRPTRIAGQLRPHTSLGAATNIASVKPILTISHTKNPATAAPGLASATRLSKPRAKSAAGRTTANPP